MEKVCSTCEKFDQCKAPCKAVNDILWADNRVMERHFGGAIVCYPRNGEVHFTELEDYQVEKFSNNDIFPWASDDLRLRKTTVFVERFFNQVSCKELAERFKVKENTIVCMYSQAVDHLKRIIEALDARREGLKATKPDRFSEDQKFFLLVGIFGFSGVEVARMFNQDHKRVSQRVKRLTDKYSELFTVEAPKEETPIDDPPITGKLTRSEVVKMVDIYVEQGLSHRQAFKRIAKNYAEFVGRAVNFRAIESRYYKAMPNLEPSADLPKEPVVVQSAYEGLSVSEIKERMTF